MQVMEPCRQPYAAQQPYPQQHQQQVPPMMQGYSAATNAADCGSRLPAAANADTPNSARRCSNPYRKMAHHLVGTDKHPNLKRDSNSSVKPKAAPYRTVDRVVAGRKIGDSMRCSPLLFWAVPCRLRRDLVPERHIKSTKAKSLMPKLSP